MSLVLHDWEISADCYRARLLAGALGLAYARVPVDVIPGRETEAPAFRALSPAGALPVLVDGDLVLCEIGAILVHLAERHDPAGLWLPREPARRARALERLVFALGPLRACDAAREAALFETPQPLADPPAAARAALRTLESLLARQALAGEPFLVDGGPTLADLAAFPAAALAIDWGEDLALLPKTRLWTRRVRALPGFVTTPGVPEFL
ncbi:glutathione S-transferase [Salinarimonas sp.]|uniref:glutathione S-transferase family protein n=1 Tax=Salinarimonas sp. TaxID=2766526 RepID=UPI0032D9778C